MQARQGAASKKLFCEAGAKRKRDSAQPQDGPSQQILIDHPVCACSNDLMAQPPLLFKLFKEGRLFPWLRMPVQDQRDRSRGGCFRRLVDQEAAVARDHVLLFVGASAERR